jgi:hypothetical protein
MSTNWAARKVRRRDTEGLRLTRCAAMTYRAIVTIQRENRDRHGFSADIRIVNDDSRVAFVFRDLRILFA